MHIHAEGPAFFSWLPKMFGKRVVVTIHDLKEKKTALKKAEKEVASLEAKKAKEDAKAAEEAKKAEAESVLKKLLAGGMSADEILAKLK